MNKLKNFMKKNKDQRQETLRTSSEKDQVSRNETRQDVSGTKPGVFITFTSSTFGERQKSDVPSSNKELDDKIETTGSPNRMDHASSDSVSSKSDFSTNDWLKFVWACENDNVAALIELIESNESRYIPTDRSLGSESKGNKQEMINGLLLSQSKK